MESALLQGRVSFSPNVMQGPLQPVSKFFLGMCASQVQAPHFGVGAPNTWLPHLRGGICVCRQNSGFSSSLLFVDPCSDFCSFYLLVWGRQWGTGWGTCLILLLKKKKKCLERKERVCCPSSRFQCVAEVSTQDLVRQRIYGSLSIPGLSVFSLIRNLCCSRLFFWSHHEQRQWGIRMRRCS